MPDLVFGTEFETRIHALEDRLSDSQLRRLVLRYCQSYQEVYSFDQLQDAFAYLDLAPPGDTTNSCFLRSERALVLAQVEEAMDEYFISLNEVATVLSRLLDPKPFSISDALSAVSHVLNAHECNEDPSSFLPREDCVLCTLLAAEA